MKSFKYLLKEKIEKEGYVSYGDLVNFAGKEVAIYKENKQVEVKRDDRLL